jgi:glycosyltransferase involved in cell wall biosynthesis
MHYHQGMDGRGGNDYEWVVPNYFDVDDWPESLSPGKYTLFFGRVNQLKGMDIIREIAKHTPVVVVGQGSKEFGELPGVEMRPPVTGRDRAKLLGEASILIAPTRFVEPYQGVSVEAQLTGTPVAVSDFGAMTETCEHGKTGWRCHTLGDYLEAIRRAPSMDRAYIASRARRLYSLDPVGRRYDAVFRQISGLLAKSSGELCDWSCPTKNYWIDIPECH